MGQQRWGEARREGGRGGKGSPHIPYILQSSNFRWCYILLFSWEQEENGGGRKGGERKER